MDTFDVVKVIDTEQGIFGEFAIIVDYIGNNEFIPEAHYIVLFPNNGRIGIYHYKHIHLQKTLSSIPAQIKFLKKQIKQNLKSTIGG